jgi:hypothetical protein
MGTEGTALAFAILNQNLNLCNLLHTCKEALFESYFLDALIRKGILNRTKLIISLHRVGYKLIISEDCPR